MFTPDYTCSDFTGIEKVTCNYYQDVATTHYYFIGYLEMLIVASVFYVVVYRILFKWVFFKFFNR